MRGEGFNFCLEEGQSIPFGEVFKAEPKLIVVSVQFWVTGDLRQEHLSYLQRTLGKTEQSHKHQLSALWISSAVTNSCCMLKIQNFTWFTVVPTDPWRTICSILASAGSWWVANANSWVFFCMSSIATSIGVDIIWKSDRVVAWKGWTICLWRAGRL